MRTYTAAHFDQRSASFRLMISHFFPATGREDRPMNIKPPVSELCRLVAQSRFAPVISPVTRVLLSPLADSFHFLRPSPVVLILRLHSPARLAPGFARLLAQGFGAELLPLLRSWVRRKPPLAAEALLSTLYCHRASWPASNHSPGKPGTFLLGMPSACSSRGSGAAPPGFNPNKKAQIARNPPTLASAPGAREAFGEHLDTAPGAERGLSRPQQCANRQRAWICPKPTTAQRMLRPGKAAPRIVRPVGKGAVSRTEKKATRAMAGRGAPTHL